MVGNTYFRQVTSQLQHLSDDPFYEIIVIQHHRFCDAPGCRSPMASGQVDIMDCSSAIMFRILS
jgi:hypothetical protein